MLITLLVTAAAVAAGTYLFRLFWETVLQWALRLLGIALRGIITFLKVGERIVTYFYRRLSDGRTMKHESGEVVDEEDLPQSHRDALDNDDEIIVKKFVNGDRS